MDENLFSKIILIVLLYSSAAFSALNPGLPEAIRFYKSPESRFPSGQASLLDLEKTMVSSQTQADYVAAWGGKDYRLGAEDLLKENQLLTQAKTSRLTLMRKEAHTGAKVITSLKYNEKVMVLESRNFWAYVFCTSCPNAPRGWISWSDLESLSEDMGFATNYIDTFLRAKPSYKSEPLTTIPKGNFFKSWKVNGDWLEISYKSKTGFVDLNHLSLRADFAKWAHHNLLGWTKIKNREGAALRTEDGLLIPLEKWNGFIGDPHKAVVIQGQDQGPQIRSVVHLKKFDGQQWKSSMIQGHGLVWWSKSLPEKTEVVEEKTLTNSEILQKDVFSFAFMSGLQPKGLISAGGIYRTEDGLTWKKIETLSNQDEPVAIIPGLGWFVGSYRSTDEGKSFEPYIRWDRMTESILNRFSKAPMFLKILKIESAKPQRLQITVDAGFRKIILASGLQRDDWEVIK